MVHYPVSSAEASMNRVAARTVLLALALLVVPAASHAQSKPRSDRNHITKEELEQAPAGVNTAHDLVRIMRPNWLSGSRGRTATSGADGNSGGATEIVLYIDEVRQQSLEDLRTVRAANVVDMRFLEQNRAIQMRGPGHELGVIEVTTTAKKD
jgi:hypothetical protein